MLKTQMFNPDDRTTELTLINFHFVSDSGRNGLFGWWKGFPSSLLFLYFFCTLELLSFLEVLCFLSPSLTIRRYFIMTYGRVLGLTRTYARLTRAFFSVRTPCVMIGPWTAYPGLNPGGTCAMWKRLCSM